MLIIDAHTVFWILLPPLLYEDSSSVDFYVLKRVLKGAIFLAVPCVVVHILVAGCCIRGLFASPNDSNPDGWPWFSCFTLASVLSATDPVAVVGALHSLNAPNKLVLLIAGESLFKAIKVGEDILSSIAHRVVALSIVVQSVVAFKGVSLGPVVCWVSSGESSSA